MRGERFSHWGNPRTIFLVAVAVRLVSILLFSETKSPELWEFGGIARNIVSGNGYSLGYSPSSEVQRWPSAASFVVPSAYMPPGYVLLIAGFLSVFGERTVSYLLILLFQCVVGAVAAVLLYRIAFRLYSNNTAVLAGYIGALYPPFIYAGLDYGSTILYLLVLGLFLLTSVTLQQAPSGVLAVAAGLLGGALALVRAEGVIIVAVICLWLMFNGLFRKSLVVIAVLIACLLPWAARNAVVFGKTIPITTSFGLNLWRGHNPQSTGTGRDFSGEGVWSSDRIDSALAGIPRTARYEVSRDSVFLAGALEFITSQPVSEIRLALKKVLFLWTIDITHPRARSVPYILSWGLLAACFFAGLKAGLAADRVSGVLLSFGAAMTIVAAGIFVLPRYQIILSFGITPISALGLSRIAGRMRPLLMTFRTRP